VSDDKTVTISREDFRQTALEAYSALGHRFQREPMLSELVEEIDRRIFEARPKEASPVG
jgi:hypothetical protein